MKLGYVIFILLLAPSCEMSAAEPIQRPTFQKGAFWHYQVSHKEWVEYDSEAIRSGDYELLYNGRRVRVFRITDGTKVEVRGRAAGELPRMLGTFDRQTRFLDFLCWKTSIGQLSSKEVGVSRGRYILTIW